MDSAVAEYLLKKSGYEVIEVTLRTWQSNDGSESRCCEMGGETLRRFYLKVLGIYLNDL